jgi:S-DNA-T family DNA segregation ATPase FtsK/SpoIIIE
VVYSFLAVFFALCLFSYSPRDPCVFIREGAAGPTANWMGPLGATLAGWLWALFGLSAWALPPGLLTPAVRHFRDRPGLEWRTGWPRMVIRALGAALLVLSAAMFLELALDRGRVVIDGTEVRAGGIVGAALGEWLAGMMSRAGALFLGALLLVVALMAAFDFSPVRAGRAIADVLLILKDRVTEAVTLRLEARKRRQSVAEEREQIEKTRTQREIKIVMDDPTPKTRPVIKEKAKPKQEKLPFLKEGVYELPAGDLLDEVSEGRAKVDQEALLLNARILENKLRDFGVQGEVVAVHPGPVITMYEYKPGSGVKINRIANLDDDLAMALSAVSVRIIAPIPGKDVVGLEISNRDRETVYLREIVESEHFHKFKGPLAMALGKGITGEPFSFDLRKAPHLLVAGSTGSGKSVSLNAMIMSVLYRATPKEVQMLMIDPKRLELSIYEGIPHLLHRVIANPKDASVALRWAVAEMERRYALLAEQGVRHIDSYNRLAAKAGPGRKKAKPESEEAETVLVAEAVAADKAVAPPAEPLPLVLVIIDELADLMMVAARDIEESICRLAQMARAAGIHLILATQRPSVDVITGLIKANFPSRIAFKVASKTDSRTILDQNGAERLLGQGDMLFLAPGTSNVIRVHGAYVSDEEIKRVTEFWREQGEPSYDDEILRPRGEDKSADDEELDEKWEEAIRLVATTKQASISMLQRKLKVGYNRAARMIELMETKGMVGPSDGVKPREVYLDPMQLEDRSG